MSKKRGKINKQVKKLFNGQGFDQGVLSLDEKLLLKLHLFIGHKPKELSKDQMLRSIRNIWSQAGPNQRKAIIKFIEKNMHTTVSQNDYSQRIEKIMDLAQPLTQDDEELAQIVHSFKEHKSKKITQKKIEAKLNHIRFKSLQDRLYSDTGVDINYEGDGEFLQRYRFCVFDSVFHKELLTPFAIEQDFHTLSYEMMCKQIEKAKLDAKKAVEQKIATVTKSLHQNHRYLNKQQLINSLKTVQHSDELSHPKIALSTIKEVFENTQIQQQKEHIVLQRLQDATLLGAKVTYELAIKIEQDVLYSALFYEKELDLQEWFEQTNTQNLAHVGLEIDALIDHMSDLSGELDITQEKITSFIKDELINDINRFQLLQLRTKAKRRILYKFNEYINKKKQTVYKQQLLKKTVRDFKNLFPIARGLQRKIIFHVGPTNSGKTYAAMQQLQKANSGYYLAPLRLLALEGYEDMLEKGIKASLITGEEEIIDEESAHICSTIEMLNFSFDVDCCVIDEVQMIDDKDRGWAWVNAIIGAPAKRVYLTGSSNALEAVKEIATWLGEELEIVRFERKNALKLLEKPIPLESIQPQTALIAFSRKEVLSLKQQLSKSFEVSVVYGNLSPEVRREEAKRFRQGQSQILIATDAISMGLNLPIKTILFSKDTKFDGESVRELNSDEVLQIAGRAGRFKLEDVGYVGGINTQVHNLIAKKFQGSTKKISPPFTVMANLDHINLVSQILNTQNLYDILDFFAHNMKFEGPFVAKRLEQMMEIAKITDNYTLDLQKKYHLSCAPVSINSLYIESKFHEYILSIEKDKKITYHKIKGLPPHANSPSMLLKVEDRVKEISLYLWLSFKFPNLFTDVQKVKQARGELNRFIENSLKFSQFVKRCKRCNKVIDFNFRYKICDHCFSKSKRGKKP